MAAKKAAATQRRSVASDKAKSKVTNADPLADLGLDTPATTNPPAGNAPVTAETVADTATGTTHEEVDVGEVELGFAEFIPTAKRTSSGSKYKFDELVAPQKKDGKTLYANFTVRLQPGVDAQKLKRSVQSATTQANRQGEAEGKYFVSRSLNKDGNFVGMQVFRTDDRPKD